MVDDLLSMWSIYDHPSDYPNHFVARRWVVSKDGPRATTDVLVADNIDVLRAEFHRGGLIVLARQPEDDVCIVETWL